MKYTILIVDDTKFHINILEDILSPEYKTISVTRGEAALEMLSQTKPDLVLLDLYMPGISGFKVLEYMKNRKEFANIPVIFITSEHNEDIEEKGLKLGAVDYIKKPFNASIARIKVRNHLELKSYRDNLELLVQERTNKLEESRKRLSASHEAIIMGMSLMSDIHDKVTGDHIERIKKYTAILATKMLDMYPEAITPSLANRIILYSPLHDIGKIAISDIILKKNGILTPDEFDIMKTHTIEGAALLRKTEHFLGNDSSTLKVAIEIAEYHHEKYDGTGYPHGLKGEEIPISARIAALADVYDALRSPRPYKKSYTHEEALSTINMTNGRTNYKHFDPKVLKVLDNVGEEFKMVYE